MRICINGAPFDFGGSLSLAGLLKQQGIGSSSGGVAIAVNERIVFREQWEQIALQEGDRIEIVHAVQGG